MNYNDLTPKQVIELIKYDIKKEQKKDHFVDSPDDIFKPILVSAALLSFHKCIAICNERLEHIKDEANAR